MAVKERNLYVILCFMLIKCTSQQFRQCSCDIPHGRAYICPLSTSGFTKYSCDEGYENTTYIISCNFLTGDWIPMFYVPHEVVADGLCIPKSCPGQIPNGELSQNCSAKFGSTCSYSCDAGYFKVYTESDINCEKSTKWSKNPHSLCHHSELQQCPYDVPNGDLDIACKRRPGDTCSFSCREGYMAPLQNSVYCDTSLRWNVSFQSVCKEKVCPPTVQNGFISSSCSMKYESKCDSYECDPGFVKRPAVSNRLICNATGQWQWNGDGLPCFREEDMCPLSNGKLRVYYYCHRQPGAVCKFACNNGCLVSNQTLTCGENSKWIEDTDQFCTNCTPVICPNRIPGGQIDLTCEHSPYLLCRFTCDTGCYPRHSNRLWCNPKLYWNNAADACDCSEARSEATVNVSIVVICSVVGAVTFLLIVVAVYAVIARNRKQRLDATLRSNAHNSENQTSESDRPITRGVSEGKNISTQ